MELQVHQTYHKHFTVSPEVYNGFIALFGDKNPLHTLDTFARKKGYREKVMHGNILNGFISHFVGEMLPSKGVVIFSQVIKYKNPVYLNDILAFNARVMDVFKSVNAAEINFTFHNQNDKKVALGQLSLGFI